ncbi:hypothetical protein AC792_07340 [Arthrobacter sp. RIT-PI-e]|uniref:hypothetical protein n=1 Tax=Arthrobacter sp. RIT-PI-e TaxID=1681197 RepID=UPI00067656AC|nr:hypothetical protein AC792_07340 [Arthrobacter sp. RIT-PI-e]
MNTTPTPAEEIRYAPELTAEARRTTAIPTWNTPYNYQRAHSPIGNQPPATRLHDSVANVMTQNI